MTKLVTDTRRIPSDHPSLEGHFLGNPVVPGAVILDNVIDVFCNHQKQPLSIHRIPQVKFLKPLQPDALLRIDIMIESDSKIRFVLVSNNEKVCIGSMLYSYDPRLK